MREARTSRRKERGPSFKMEDWSNYTQIEREHGTTNNGCEAINSTLRTEVTPTTVSQYT